MSAYEHFVIQRKRDLQRIARMTRGECQYEDVCNEAWMLALELQAHALPEFDFADVACQEKLLARLFQRLVRYTETHCRYAVRLDHGMPGHEEDGHPLLRTLAASDAEEPLNRLLARQDREAQANEVIDPHASLAGAYVYLLKTFDNRMRMVAEHLLISLSYAYRCCARARLWAGHQLPIPLGVPGSTFDPKPWRPFRIRRPPVQLELDFGLAPRLWHGDDDLGRIEISR